MTIYRGAGSGDATFPLLRAAAQDDRLSYRARGVLAAVMSRPRDWRVGGAEQLAREGREGEAAVAAALLELEHYGYLRRGRRRVPKGDPKRRAGTIVTIWEITDDPTLLRKKPQVDTGTRLPRGGQPWGGGPSGGQPSAGGPSAGDPRSLQMEREGVETPPPPPAERAPDHAEVDELVGVVARTLDGRAPVPAARTLRRACAGIAAAGWTPDQVAHLIRTHDWSRAGAGAVIALLRDPGTPPVPARQGPQERPAWCGACDETTRLLDAPQEGSLSLNRTMKCPTCHPSIGRAS